jgi:nicotinamide mononucleotide transporter
MTIIEIIAVVFSLLSVWLTSKNNIWCWPTGIIGVLSFSYLFYITGEFANLILQFIFLLQSVLGWLNWSKSELEVSKIKKEYLPLLFYSFYSIGLITYSLTYFNSNNPLLDSLTATLSIFGMILLMYKKLESWYFWIFADFLYIFLFIKNGLYLSTFVYFIFFINAIYGLKNWKKLYKLNSIIDEE